MKPLAFVGKLPASKSMLNRLHLAKSYAPKLQIKGDSDCDDVQVMKAALERLGSGETLHAGEAGTVFRFLVLRASRLPGEHIILGHPRLLARPQDELLKILRQLGVEAKLSSDRIELKSEGWRLHGDTLLVPSARSSQFASSVLLNAWNLPFDLFVSLGGQKVSEGYWRMSVRMAQALGMKVEFWDGDFRIPKAQAITAEAAEAETDMSSAFALAAVAAVSGRATLLDFPQPSLQPDAVFVEVLRAMGVPVALVGGQLKVERAHRLNGIAFNLNSCPDLFPVLAALSTLAEGESELYGAPQLVHKESNRLDAMVEMIQRLGREVERREDGIVVRGAAPSPTAEVIRLDPLGDHRLAFAGAVWAAAGFPIEITTPEVVAKSFPEFWQLIGWNA